MSGEEDHLRFDVRRRRSNEIRCQQRKTKSASMSGKVENMKFDVSRGT
jgi:hypothetical protein